MSKNLLIAWWVLRIIRVAPLLNKFVEVIVPYSKLSELPESVRNSLPKHGQEIYKSAFNSAWEEYVPGQTDGERSKEVDPEEVSHRIAWSAVKKKYAKVKEGVWKAKD